MLNRHVTLNTFKTELLIFSHKPAPPAAFSISIDGPDRLSFMQTKNLGGILDYSFSYTSLALPWKFIHKACILCLFTTTLVQLLSSWNKLLTGPPTSTLALLRCILNTATRVTLFKLKSDYVIQNSIVILSQNKSQYPCNGLDGLTWSYRLTSVISSPNTLPPAHSSPDTLVFLLFLKHAGCMPTHPRAFALAVLSGCSTGQRLHFLQLSAYRLAQISPSWRPTLFNTTTWPTPALIS